MNSRYRPPTHVSLVAATLLLLLTSACGGGGGSDENASTTGDAADSGETAGNSSGTSTTSSGDTAAALAELAAAYGGDIGDSPPSLSTDSVGIDVVRHGPRPADASVTVGWSGDVLKLVSLDGELPDWLTVYDGIVDTRPQTFDFRLRHTDIAAGQYTLNLAFVDIDERITGDEIRGATPFTLTLTVSDTMTLDQERLRFHIVHGQADAGISQSVAIYGIDSDWRARSYYDWLSLDNETGTADSALVVSLSGSALLQPPGVHAGTLDVSADAPNSVTLPVELVVEPRRLSVQDHGLAFSAWPGEGGLRSQSVPVSDTAATVTTPWQASSDAAWLRLGLPGSASFEASASGITGQNLEVSVLADTLPAGYHEAEITLKSTDADVSNTVTIVAGLTVLGTEPVVSASTDLAIVSKAVGLVADPVRGRVYVSEGFADIRVFDVYSGEELAPINGLGTDIRDLAISDEGRTLYAVDVIAGSDTAATDPEATPANVLVIDPSSGALIRRIDGSVLPECAGCSVQAMSSKILDLAPVHIDGRQLLATNALVLLDPDSGELVHDFAADLAYPVNCCGAKDPLIEASADGRQLYIMNTGVSPGEMHRVDVATSTQVPETVRTRYVASATPVGNRDLAVSPDGSRVCVAYASNGGIPCFATDAGDDSSTGLAPLESLPDVDVGHHVASAFGADGRLYTGQSAFGFTDESVGVYDLASGTRVAGTVVPTQLSDRQLVVSGDSQRLITRSNGHRVLQIQSVPGN